MINKELDSETIERLPAGKEIVVNIENGVFLG